MERTVFLGRQPIFDRRRKVFGYELLYRSGDRQNAFDHADGDQATREVINNSLHVVPMELSADKRAFINITRRLLLDQTWSILPADRAVVELLENVAADAEVLAALKQVKEAGYLLALDDFVLNAASRPLVEYADIIKIDFLACDKPQRQRHAEELGGGKIMLLAEKVETPEDFQQGMEMGYSYFQGYFFCKPEILSGKEVPAIKHNYLMFMQEVCRPDLNFDRLEEIIKHEVSLFNEAVPVSQLGRAGRATPAHVDPPGAGAAG